MPREKNMVRVRERNFPFTAAAACLPSLLLFSHSVGGWANVEQRGSVGCMICPYSQG